MTTIRRRRLPLIAVAGSLAIAVPLVLSGCSLIPHLPGSAGGSGSSGGVTIPGVGSVGSGKLPKDFPSDVPVAKGDVVSGVSIGSGANEIWNVTIKVADVNAFDGIQSQLAAAGFSVEADAVIKSDSGATAEFNGDKHDVLVAIAKSDDKTGWVANYSVTKASN
jgi:hypothetical protein